MRLIPTTLAVLAMSAIPLLAQTAPEAPAEGPPAGNAAAPATDAADAAAGGGEAADADPVAGSLPGSDQAVPDAGTYVFSPDHSHVVWSYEHMGFSTSTGLIRGVTGSITLDPADPAASRVEASFPLSSVQSVAAALDEHLRGEEFFAGDAPDTAITFTSTEVEVTGARTAKVTGDLTLNGVTAPVTLDVRMRGVGQNPVANKPAVGLQGTGMLRRSDFGLGAFAPAVSDEVQLEVNVEAHKG